MSSQCFQVMRDSGDFPSKTSAIPQPKKNFIPRLNFLLQDDGRNNQDFQTISQTQRDDCVGIFRTADSHQLLAHSALQSTRTYNASTMEHSTPLLSNRMMNLESTQDLRNFVTIDLAKINLDRQNQLKLALEDNLHEKETQVNEILSSFKQQRNECDKSSQALEQRTRDLETEIARQRDHVTTLKRQAAQIDGEQQANERDYQQQEFSISKQLLDYRSNLSQVNEELQSQDSELQILSYERQSIEQRIDVRHKVRIQELDVKVKPLSEERDHYLLQIQLMQNNLDILQGVKEQNENEKQMIEEDISASNQTKYGLIYQREEIEQYMEKLKSENQDVSFLANRTLGSNDFLNQWDHLMDQLIAEKKNVLLLDLIRELHQYILGMSSNTTDNSVMQSDELEELQFMIEKNTISTQDAVELVSDFAQSKIKLNLNPEVLQSKLDQVITQIDEASLRESLNDLNTLEAQMREFDCRAKIITNRCQNELLPRQKALILSEASMNEEIGRVQSSLLDIQSTLEILDGEIDGLQDEFERTQPIMQSDATESLNLKQRAQELKEQIETLEDQVSYLRGQREELSQATQALQEQLENLRDSYGHKREELQDKYHEVLESIKREKTRALQFEYTNPNIQELTREVAQHKCDKEAAQKRLRYMESKLQNAQESVSHAKQVLDNHLLQIQQDQLHQKINQSAGMFKQRRRTSVHQASQEEQTPIILQKRNQEIQRAEFNQVQILSSQQIRGGSIETSERVGTNQWNRVQQNTTGQDQVNDKYAERKRLHQQLIEPDDSSKSTLEVEDIQRAHGNLRSERTIQDTMSVNSKGLSQQHRDVIRAYLQKDKSVSAADLVKYNCESSAAASSLEEMQSNSHPSSQNLTSKHGTLSAINLVALAQSKNIPIQTLITPRENLNDMMQYNHSHQASIVSQQTQYEIGYCGQFRHNSSIGSADSICQASEHKLFQENLYRQGQSINIQDSPSIHSRQSKMQHSQSLYQPNHQLPSVKISLRSSHNNSIDDARYLGNSMRSSINFKENIAPNTNQFTASSSTLNLRNLSQAASLATLQGQQNKPPAVPQGKVAHHTNQNSHSYYLQADMMSDSSRKRLSMPLNSIQKGTKNHDQQLGGSASSSQFSSNRQSIGFQNQPQVQTKMRLCQNTNNGKILAVGIVDLSRCNQSMMQRDIQFFENTKPLIEGAQFMFFSKQGGSQCHAKHIYLDFSLLRLFITATSNSFNADRREILMVENIIKTELPQVTLDLIRSDKQGGLGDSQTSYHHSSISSSSGLSTNKRYEFHIIFNNSQTGYAERMQMVTKNYEELRLWIIGLNALIGNKKDLMRLSTMIKS